MPRSSSTPTPSTFVRFIREREGKLARDVARDVGVSVGTYSRIESGHNVPSLSVARAIAEELGVPVELLFPQNGAPSLEDVVNAHIAEQYGKRYGKKWKAKR